MIYGISAIMGIAAVMFSRKLNVEGIGLVGIALMDIYIFLTDPNHVLPQIRQEREARQEVKEAERVEKNLELESEGESESETE